MVVIQGHSKLGSQWNHCFCNVWLAMSLSGVNLGQKKRCEHKYSWCSWPPLHRAPLCSWWKGNTQLRKRGAVCCDMVLCTLTLSIVSLSPASIPAVDFNNSLSDLLPVYFPQFLAKWQVTPLLQHNQVEDAALCYELAVWVGTLIWVSRSKWCTRTVQQEVKGNTIFHDADFPPSSVTLPTMSR